MTKVMDARAGLSRTGVDPHRSHDTQKYGHNAGRPHATATQGDKHVIVLNCSSAIQLPLEADHRRRIQRHQAALLELCFPNHQAVFSYVVESEVQRLGNAQAGDGQQREKR